MNKPKYNAHVLMNILKELEPTRNANLEQQIMEHAPMFLYAREVAEKVGISIQKATAYLLHLYDLGLVMHDDVHKLSDTESALCYWRR